MHGVKHKEDALNPFLPEQGSYNSRFVKKKNNYKKVNTSKHNLDTTIQIKSTSYCFRLID